MSPATPSEDQAGAAYSNTWDQAEAIMNNYGTPRKESHSQTASASSRHHTLPPEPSLSDNLRHVFITPAVSMLGEVLQICVLKAIYVVAVLFLWLIVMLLVIATAYSGGKLILGRAWAEVNGWGCEHLPWPVTSGFAWDCPSSTSNIYETQSALNDIWRSSAFTGSSSDATFAGAQSTTAQLATIDIQQALSRAATADPVSREIALITELTDQLHTRLLSSGLEDLKELAIIVEEVHRTIHLIGGAVKQTAFGLRTLLTSIHVTAVLALQELQALALSQSVRACGMISSPTGVANLADALHDQAQQLQELLLTLRAALVSLRTQAGPMRHIQLSLAEHEENLRSTLFKLLDNAWIKVRHSVGFSTAFTRRNMHGMERVQWLQRVLADTRSSVTVIELELEAVTGHLQEIVGQISREDVPCTIYLRTLQATLYDYSPVRGAGEPESPPSLD